MALEALFHPRRLLAGDGLIHHAEVHHRMTGWRFVALRAVGRHRTWMYEAEDLPGGDHVTASALLAEETLVLVRQRVTGLAVERAWVTGGVAG